MSSLALQLINKLLTFRPNHFESMENLHRYRLDCPKPRAGIPMTLARLCHVKVEYIAEREVITLEPKYKTSDNTLIYLHGGGFVSDLILPHWFIIEYLIKKTGAKVVVPLYRTIPNATIDSELPILVAIYQQFQTPTKTGAKIFVLGDSAGGGLALALTLQLQQQGITAPYSLFLFSPWVDVTMENPAIADVQPNDSMLSVVGTRWCGKQWAGQKALTDPLVSPLYMQVSEFPSIHIYQGTYDILYPDILKFEQHAQALGIICHVKYYQEGFHAFVGLPWIPESKAALDDVGYQISIA